MLSRIRFDQIARQWLYAGLFLGASLLGLEASYYLGVGLFGSYFALIGAVGFGILVPKKRDIFRCPGCNVVLGKREFLQFGSEFKGQMARKYSQGCPFCMTPLFPVEQVESA